MKKLTLLFLAAALGVSVFGAEPKFKVGDEVLPGSTNAKTSQERP